MSETDIKLVLLRLPVDIAREAKADAARREMTLRRWWTDAAVTKLREGDETQQKAG